MAPEILLGEIYNEKVDVFSYAMCLIEITNFKLPWSGVAMGAEVPHRVTTGRRPTAQLRDCDATLAELITDCWNQLPAERPDFVEIVQRTEAMFGAE